MEQQAQAEFKGWALVEVMGHQQHIGYVETQSFGAAVLFRVDTPDLPEREFVLNRPEYHETGMLPAGSKVKRGALAACSVLLGAGSIYRITPITETHARELIDKNSDRPLIVLERAAKAALPPPEDDDNEYDSDFEDKELAF